MPHSSVKGSVWGRSRRRRRARIRFEGVRKTRDDEALLSALGYVWAGTLVSAGETVVAPLREPDSPIAPPLPLIGAVWTALFACFGVARARLRGLPKERRLVDALWLMCVTYPLYTDGIRSRAAAYAVIAGTAGAIVARARRKGRNDAAAFVLPWVAVATLTLPTERRR